VENKDQNSISGSGSRDIPDLRYTDSDTDTDYLPRYRAGWKRSSVNGTGGAAPEIRNAGPYSPHPPSLGPLLLFVKGPNIKVSPKRL
jgi:hypothetical protein